MEEVKAEVEDGPGHGLAIDEDVLFDEVPAAWTHKEDGNLVVELVLLLRGGVSEGNRAADGVAQVELAFEEIVPQRRAGIFKVGHEDLGAGVEGVDDHFAIDRAGDLDAAIHEVGGQRSDGPCGLANLFCVGKKIGLFAGIDALLAFVTRREQIFAARIEGALADSTMNAIASGVRISAKLSLTGAST